MTARNLQNLNTDLEETGFVQTDGDRFRWETLRGKSAKRHELPWEIVGWELEARGTELYQTSFAARLNADHFLQNCEDLLRDRFPAFRKVALQDDKKGGHWILIEFLDRGLDADQSRLIESDDPITGDLPHGLAAVHLSVIQAVGQLSLFMTKHCFIGNTPGSLFIELPKLLNLALFGTALSDKTNFNAYLLTLRSEELRSSLIEFCQLPEFVHNLLIDKGTAEAGFGQIRLGFEGKNWHLSWSHGEEVPELLVPPMEILEQKEVARRFQRLDELILLEDFAGALKQCQEYLEKNPQSLYLIRRWAFLSLWAGIDFDQKYLDLMMKFDPTNYMTLSLWVRHGLKSINTDVLLENLSKLGSSLGQNIVDFEVLDITSLTLPEMLGDAWNQKDDQRAVSCYERVLLARGEIPRILVKLIRLMRDTDDASAEESYMDRLLSCEVPTRTRAAIYFRLAEIKQKMDPADACQWALKSWHTNRGHVRYAILAADLLIQLGRSQDAAHVLVETSELLEGKAGEMRLELEIKIAGIWLEHMQRLDLAAERVTRALELIQDEVQVYDEIIRLVQKLDDASLLLNVTKRALVLADSKRDYERMALYVQVLIDLGDAEKDVAVATDIFTVVLKNSLLPPSTIQTLFKRDDLQLPFAEIVEALEAHIVLLSPEEQGIYLQMLGDMSQDRLEVPERVLGYYEGALNLNSMHARSFDFLDSYYSRMGMNAQRFTLLQKKLTQATGGERAVLLRELYYFDEGVSDADKDSYALQILSADADDVGPVEERLSVYEQNHNGEAILHLTTLLKTHNVDEGVISGFVRSALNSVQSIQSSNRHLWLIQLLGRLREMGEDALEIARLTVQYLWDADEKTWVRGPLALLISRGEIPDIAPGEMLTIIEDDNLKVDLLLQLADRATDFEEIIAYEREALRLAREIPGFVKVKLDIQRRLALKSEFTVAELDQFLKEGKSLGQESDSIQYLTSQLRHSTHGDLRTYVLEHIQDTIAKGSIAADDGTLLVQTLLEMPDADSLPLRLTWLTRFGIQTSLHDLASLELILGDSLYWENEDLLLILITHVLETTGRSEETKGLINTFLLRILSQKKDKLLKVFIEHDLIKPVLDNATLRAATDYFLASRDSHSFLQYWSQNLLALEERQESIEFLHYSRRAFATLELSRIFFEKIEAVIDSATHTLDPHVLFEVKLFFADYLIETNSSSRKARNLLESMYAERPTESRVWGGLIALYREARADSDLYELLHKVLPSLKDDPRPLKEYQLSVAGLELEFNELSARMAMQKDSSIQELPIGFDFSHLETVAKQTRAEAITVLSMPVHEARDAERPDVQAPVFELGDMSLTYERSRMVLEEEADRRDEESHQKSDFDPSGFSMQNESAFAFGNDTRFDAMTTNQPPSALPMHTQVAELPDFNSQFRLDATETGMKLKLELDSVSLYEHTNVYTPNPDLRSKLTIPPPLPPSPTALRLEDDEEEMMSSEPIAFENGPESVMPELGQTHIAPEPAKARGDLSAAWRHSARTHTPDVGLLKELLNNPLANGVEQIVAVQAAALIEDKIALLDTFPQRVWRDPESIRFELKWTDRMTREMFHPGVKSPLARLLKALYPLFIQAFGQEMGLSGVADRLKMRSDEVLKIRRPIEFMDEVIQRTNLRYYVASLQENGYHLYHLPSIGDRFQFDFEKRDIYIDRSHYMAAPPSHIFHRLAFLLRAVSLDYFPFLHLSPGGEIFPFLMKCKRSLDQTDGVKRVLGLEKDPLKAVLAQAKDRDYIAHLFAELGSLSADRISQTNSHFIEQIYRLNLAETLDLIGVIETISGVDLCNPRANPFQRISQSSSAKSILAFAGDLKFVQKF
ncbi:MAG: hypothetical protein H7249_20675 [Chitinophagaceae bacterium]|nr:hypothetical protein [Oligoflexus sp.]